MPDLFLREGAAPATPSEGVRVYATVATPSILRLKDDSGNDWGVTPLKVVPTAWTPGISFGGGTTGITYTTQVGRYARHGEMVLATCIITLSNKGSSTGTALITGLPIASANVSNVFHAVNLRANVLASITGDLMGFISANDTNINLEFLGTGTRTLLTEAHFNNTSTIIATAMYLAA